MKLQEQISRINEIMGIDNFRLNFNIQKLVCVLQGELSDVFVPQIIPYPV